MALRFITAKREHCEELAQLHADAFPDFFLTRLGQPFLRQFYLGYTKDPSAITSVAIQGTAVLGAAVGTVAPAGYFKRLLLRQLPGLTLAAARAAVRNPAFVPRLARALTYRGNVPGHQPGALLSSICVAKTSQSTGIGTKLLHDWENRASAAGATHAYLTTDAINNNATNRFYQANCWIPTSQHTTPEQRRMNVYTRNLNAPDEHPERAWGR